MQTALSTTLSQTAAAHQARNARLLAETAKKAAEIAKDKEVRRRADLRRRLDVERRKAERVAQALEAVNALCTLGASAEMQALIAARGGPLLVWGGKEDICPGGDMNDVFWRWVSFVEIGTTALRIINYTASSGNHGLTFKIDKDDVYPRPLLISLLYSVGDEYLRSRPLWRIATHRKVNADDWSEGGRDISFLHSTELLFETLVMWSDPQKLERAIRRAVE